MNSALLKTGQAWHAVRYDRSPDLALMEAQARADRLGLWLDPAPTPPWGFRARK